MTTREDYSAEEWKTVALGPLVAGVYVSTADHLGSLSFLRESLAVVAAIGSARETADTELVRAVSEWWSQPDTRPDIPGLTGGAGARRGLLDLVREADALVEEKSPEALADYRLWCLECGLVAARAHHEGQGPESVTDAERTAFAELAATLHITRR
jgi:hypothetical protein